MAKHSKPCPACNGSGKIAQMMMDRKTGKMKVHNVKCYGCGGSGRV